MKFSVATNFQDDFLEKIKNDSVVELFGKLSSDFIGGLRSSYNLPKISRAQLKKAVEEAHCQGLQFNYLLNAVSLRNFEYTSQGQKEITRLLSWLQDIGVDSVSVTIPYLLEIIKKRFKRLKVRVSVGACVDTVEKAKFWEGLGADEMTLSEYLNRDFKRLEAIRKNTQLPLILIANVACLHHCPISKYHATLTSHSSQSSHPLRGYVIDYCALSCRYKMILDPVSFISADWIRPEDVHYYEKIGIDVLKLADRCADSDTMARIVNAYVNKSFEGNLLDLFPTFLAKKSRKKADFARLRFFFRPFYVNIFKLRQIAAIMDKPRVFIDNKKLDGFLEGFFLRDCSLLSCEECAYCREIAEKVVKIDEQWRKDMLKRYKKILDNLNSGKMFRYL